MTHGTTIDSRRGVPRGWLRLALVAFVAAVLVAAAAAPARAAFGVAAFDGQVAADAAGDAFTQAGGHPYSAGTTIAFNSHPDPGTFGMDVPDADARTLEVALPPGLIGNPAAVPRCARTQFSKTSHGGGTDCPVASQVGYAFIDLLQGVRLYSAVWNLEPSPGTPATFGFQFAGIRVVAEAAVRTGTDYGITLRIANINQGLQILDTSMVLWGVPASTIHDDQRCSVMSAGAPPACTGTPGDVRLGPNTANVEPVPFLSNPTACTAPGTGLATDLTATSWQEADVIAHASFESHLPPGYPADPADWGTPQGPTGCAAVPFEMDASVAATAHAAGSPTGLDVTLTAPQDGLQDPGGLATAHLKRAVVTLPAGMTVNPASANGLGSCAPAQIALDSAAQPTCPGSSKIGTVQIDTPLLDEPLDGAVYLAKQHDNPFGSLLALYLVASDADRGVTIKLPGKVDADPRTGRLTATFDDNPQLPFTTLHLQLKGGSRAPLVTPATCGTFTSRAVLTSWSGASVTRDSAVTVDQGCGQHARFTPSLTAGTTDPVAGGSSSFVLRFSRPDGQRELGAVNGSLPPGLLGVLASVPLCGAVEGAAGRCPASSRVGRVQVAAGAGSSPVWLPVAGQSENGVYLTEPYRKGDVAGMSIVTRAVAGPFDLGTVVTKVYLKLRPEDQGLDMQSDRLPRILGGIPLQIRKVVVTVDRKGFMVNPTSCRVMATYANVFSQSWAKVPVTSRFQVGGCASLAFSPIIAAQAGGKGDVRRYEHPALTVSVRQPAGQAHLSKTDVVLPKALNIDLKAPALKAACPREVYAKDQCSPVATVGTVRAVTPLLREPLEGPAFLIQKKGKLPDLVMRLRNNRMSLDLIGVLDFLKDGRLITRVKGIPDAALSSFVLNIKGGKDGSLLNRSDLCARKRLTKATFKGQNGKLSRKTPVTHITGCAKAKARSAARSRAASRRAARSAGARASAAQATSARAAAVHAPRGAELHPRAAGGRF